MHNHISKDERILLNIFRELNPYGRETLLNRAAELLELKRYTQSAGDVLQFKQRTRPPV